MQKSKIQLAPLKKALIALRLAIAQKPVNEFYRDSVIQRFEYTFELSWKIMQKFLEADRPLQDSSVRGVLRESFKRGFIRDTEQWFVFQESRNLTSHTYNEKTAQDVYEVALKLPEAVDFVIERLESSLQDGP
jgi:nucleotidyltransferase substrate binding protein (TIGR01987 family)